MLDENADFLTQEQLEQHVSRLNRDDFQALETEWEVAVLNAFSKIGKVQHEPDLGGSSRLDLLFIHEQNKYVYFVADVATVSDEGFENETPLKAFDVELKRRINKAGLRGNSFGYSVKSHPTKFGDKIRLMLPIRGEFAQEIFNGAFKSFLNQIKLHPDQACSHHISTAKTNILISYNPRQGFFTASWSYYKETPSKTQNPIYNALKLKAQNQFRKISYSGPKGIIICDGGSDMVHRQPRGSFHFDHNAADAINEFLRQNQSIDFVLQLSSIWTDAGRYQLTRERPLRKIQVKLFPNTNFDSLPEGIKNSLVELEKHFPEPENTAEGTRETIRHGFDPRKFRPLMGGIEMSNNEIKISANDVLGLLAGVITQEEFFKSLKFKPQDNSPSSTRNLFEYFLAKKMRIIDVQVEGTPYDNTKLVFKLNGPDPAISPFVNPKSEQA
jgi:hypothetical protein